MSDQELQELENPENWEDESEVLPAVKSRRAVVSVAFSREDFEYVVERAQLQGMKTSELIREAALAHLSEQPAQAQAVVLSVSGNHVRTEVPFIRVQGPQPKAEIPQSYEVLTTAF